jgi:predicted nucleic acid-binding protein
MATKERDQSMDGFVLDCSLTMSWCFADEADAYAKATLKSIPTALAIVPVHWRLEVNHALLRGERRGRITRDEADEFLISARDAPDHDR